MQHLKASLYNCKDFHTPNWDNWTFVVGLAMDLLSFDVVSLAHLLAQLQLFFMQKKGQLKEIVRIFERKKSKSREFVKEKLSPYSETLWKSI